MANVLVVDDSSMTHMLLDVMLKRLGHHIVSAYDGLEALEIVDRMQVDLIVSDINMPNMDGLTFLDKLKGMVGKQNIPVIIISAISMEDYQNQAIEKGASAFLIQPFSSVIFSKLVGECLGEVKLR